MAHFAQLNSVSFAYDKLSKPILNQISLAFHQGWSSLCGVNGSGKTTLFRLLNGELKATEGHILVKGSVTLVPQETIIPPQYLDEFRFDYSSDAISLKSSFQITDDWFDRWAFLSVGQRKKMQVAAALSQNPAILLIDEPTNHVDVQTKYMILAALKSLKTVGVLVSHDRLLLNELCQQTIFLSEGQCYAFQAAYDVALSEFSALKSHARSVQGLKKEELQKVKQAVQSQTEKIDQKRHKLSKRGVDKKDHDTKEKIDRARLFNADRADTRRQKILQNKGQKLQKQLAEMQLEKEYRLGVFFEEIPKKKSLFLPESTIIKSFMTIVHPTIYAKSGDKIGVVGNNGTGKSTFLQTWFGQLNHEDIAFAKQEPTSKEQEKLLEAFTNLDSITKGKIMTLVRCLGSDPKTFLETNVPSPGVWQKIIIARAIVLKTPVLFLDEPTNHMDLTAIVLLEEALQLYQGILVVVSHDMSFIKAVCTQTLCFTRNGDTSIVRVVD